MNQVNDDFLLVLRQAPDPQFARGLQQRLRGVKPKQARGRHWLSAAAVIGVVLAALIMASPEVRAQIAQQIESLFYGPVELIVVTQKLGPSSSEMRVSPIPNMTIDESTPAEAQMALSHQTPSWIPDGLTQDTVVSVIHWNDEELGIGYRWMDEHGETEISLSIMNIDTPRLVIGAGANSREIEINGETGTIYNGSYDYRAWVPEGYLNLVWVMDGVTYHLGSATATEDELVRMAESFR